MKVREIVFAWDRFGETPPTERQFKAACAWIDAVGSLDRLQHADRLHVDALIRKYRGAQP